MATSLLGRREEWDRVSRYGCMGHGTLEVTAILVMAVAVRLAAQPSATPTPPASPHAKEVADILAGLPPEAASEEKPVAECARKIQALCGGASLAVLRELAVTSPSKAVRRNAVIVLGEQKPAGASDVFLQILQSDADEQQKELALDSLKDDSTDEAIRQIVLTTARAGMGRLRSKAQRALFRIAEQDRDRLMKALMRLTKTPGIRPEDAMARNAGVAAMGLIPGPTTSDFLYQQLDSLDDEVRASAVKALARRRFTPALEKMSDLLARDTNEAVRREAAVGLGMAGGEGSIPPLIAALSDPEGSVRQAALDALRRITGKRFGPEAGVWSLWWKQQTESLATLYAMLDEKREESVIRAIGLLRKERLQRKEVAERLQPFVFHASPKVQQEALAALGDLGQEESVPVLIEALDSNDSATLVAAIGALGKMRCEREKIVAAVAGFVTDYDDTVVAVACAALGDLGGEEAVPCLLNAVGTLEGKPLYAAVRALGKIGAKDEKVSAALRDLTESDDLALLVEVYGALGQTRDRTAIPTLIEALGDARPPAAAAAHGALVRITGQTLPPDSDKWSEWWEATQKPGQPKNPQ